MRYKDLVENGIELSDVGSVFHSLEVEHIAEFSKDYSNLKTAILNKLKPKTLFFLNVVELKLYGKESIRCGESNKAMVDFCDPLL